MAHFQAVVNARQEAKRRLSTLRETVRIRAEQRAINKRENKMADIKYDSVVALHTFEEDAAGLGSFITDTMKTLGEDENIVYVEDDEGRHAVSAKFVRKTLTDGSTSVDLVISFE